MAGFLSIICHICRMRISLTLWGILSLSLVTSTYAQRQRGGTDSGADQRNIEFLLAEAEKYYLIEDYSKALDVFLQILEEDEKNPVVHYKIAEIYTLEDKYPSALSYAQSAVDFDPDNKYYYLQLADVHARLTNYADAARTYEDLMKRIPGTDEYLYELAALYLFERNIDKGLKTYRRIEETYGKSAEISYQIQKILIAQNKVEDAIEEAESLIEAYPNEPEHVFALVDLLLNQGQNSRAIPYLENTLRDFPDNNRAHLVLADLYRREGSAEAGIKHLSLAVSDEEVDLDDKLRLLTGYILLLPNEPLGEPLKTVTASLVTTHPQAPQAYGIYGDLLFQIGDKPGAREQYLKGVEIDPSNFDVWQNIVAIDWEQQNYEQVVTVTEEALELFPNQALLYYYNGHALYLQNEYQESTYALEQGKRLAFRNPDLQGVFHGLLGDAYNALKQYTKSDRAYEDALRLDPDNLFVLNNYSYFLSLRRENLNRARDLSSHLVELEPDNSTYLDTHAWVLYQLGEYQSAADYLKRAVNQGNPSGTILEHYGDVLYRLNRVDEALKQWERALEQGGHSELLNQKISDRQLYENQ
ncbi:MAG: tetratricopeptide repeat protein [Bacteroidota bacterium]